MGIAQKVIPYSVIQTFSVSIQNVALSETSAPSVILQSKMPPFSGENGNPFVATRHFP